MWCAMQPLCFLEVFAQQPTPNHVQNTLRIKFRANSATMLRWEANARKGSIDELTEVLGKHTTKAFIDDGLLSATREILFKQASEENPYRITEGLQRWCEVELRGKIRSMNELLLLAKKLERFSDIQNAELIPIYSLHQNTLNDPLISSQYYLTQIQAIAACDAVRASLPASDTRRIIVGVVDGGVDYVHEDLQSVMYTNPGESGTDANGKDRRTNGVDDDRNGRIDDWRGWDFAGDDGRSEDNDPRNVVNDHGTHVAGTIGATSNNRLGIAGVFNLSSHISILPVKCGTERGRTNAIYNGLKGVLYAATMGANVINCSFGDYAFRSDAEQEIINVAERLGAVVVASAGNDGVYAASYPGAYQGVLTVGWLNENGRKSGSSNYYPSIGINAPGSNIFATMPENQYGIKSGTSMAAPQVSAAAALVKMRYPSMTPRQIVAHLKATADNNDNEMGEFARLMGAGRVNILRAVQSSSIPTISLEDYTLGDENGNGIWEAGERVSVTLHLRAGQAAIQDANAEMWSPIAETDRNLPFWDELRKPLPIFTANELKRGAVTFTFRLTQTLPQDFQIPLMFTFRASNNAILGRDGIIPLGNLSFRTMDLNNIRATVTSIGGIGYNNFPSRTQGGGVHYKPLNANDLVYAGGLMIASAPDSISTCVQMNSNQRDRSFVVNSVLSLAAAPDSSSLVGKSIFADRNGTNDAGVSVEMQAAQYRSERQKNILYYTWKITNTSQRDFTRLYAGMFFDWDIGQAWANETFWDDTLKVGLVRSTNLTNQPIIAVQLLTPQTANFMPIVYGDTTQNSLSLDSFARSDKWFSLTSGITRGSKLGDVANVLSAGPISLARNTSVTVSIAITIASSLPELRTILRGDTTLSKTIIAYPNPAINSFTTVNYSLTSEQNVSMDVVNSLGQVVVVQLQNTPRIRGNHQELINLEGLSRGAYFVRVRTNTGIQAVPILISR